MTKREELVAKIAEHMRSACEVYVDACDPNAARVAIADAMSDLLAKMAGPMSPVPPAVMSVEMGDEPGVVTVRFSATTDFLGRFAEFLYDVERASHEDVTMRLTKVCSAFRDFMCEMHVRYDDDSEGVRWMLKPQTESIFLSLTIGEEPAT